MHYPCSILINLPYTLSSTLINNALFIPAFDALKLANLCSALHQNIKTPEKIVKLSIHHVKNKILIIEPCRKHAERTKKMINSSHNYRTWLFNPITP